MSLLSLVSLNGLRLQLLAMKKREKEEELRALRLSVAAEKKKSEDNLEWSKMQAEKDRMSHSIVGREWMMDNRRQKALQKQEEEYALRCAATTPVLARAPRETADLPLSHA